VASDRAKWTDRPVRLKAWSAGMRKWMEVRKPN
jgi:hypothetical protein